VKNLRASSRDGGGGAGHPTDGICASLQSQSCISSLPSTAGGTTLAAPQPGSGAGRLAGPAYPAGTWPEMGKKGWTAGVDDEQVPRAQPREPYAGPTEGLRVRRGRGFDGLPSSFTSWPMDSSDGASPRMLVPTSAKLQPGGPAYPRSGRFLASPRRLPFSDTASGNLKGGGVAAKPSYVSNRRLHCCSHATEPTTRFCHRDN